MSEATPDARTPEIDAWTWWEARRLGYNLALAAAGCVAYGLYLALRYARGSSALVDWRYVVSTTIQSGSGFLVLMFVANICFLLGVLVEGWAKPLHRDAYRKRAFALGLWASIAIPFFLPLMTLAYLIGTPYGHLD